MRIFGIDPGSIRTGYGCVETGGSRHVLVTCGAISAPAGSGFAERLHVIHETLTRALRETSPDCVAIENLFHARNVRSALQLGHARGVAMLAAVQAGVPIVEYTPAEIKLAVVGYGRADKVQVQHMVKLLLGLTALPKPFDASDALAAALCHSHSGTSALARRSTRSLPRHLRNWRDYRPATAGRQAP
ncbi:MAG: crossover junction endodeoxyribonuclease RuvC [Acidobacteria bacterium]|nr:crossover junction endodeoxyribonuclease RuvC [Acidobacteriota bacterium]